MKLHILPWSSAVALALFFTVQNTDAEVSKGDIPPQLLACYQNYGSTNLRNVVGELLMWFCDTTVIRGMLAKTHPVKKTTSSLKYINHLVERVHHKRRRKRQAAEPKCRRKEYRMLTDTERTTFHNAINTLKRDTTVTPNKYDALAAIHTGAVDIAHGGPMFLPWHRVYVIMYEIALQEVDPSICMPYWDSSLDNELGNPGNSYVFTRDFLGNSDMTEGPFAGWRTPENGPLVRNVGGNGELYSISGIEDILSRERTHEIVPPNAEPQYDLEFQHGGIHVFIGGHMMQLQTSSFDPIFWLHHAFVDYLWELFRTKQRALRINPEMDYPEDFGASQHAFNASMGFGLGLTAEQGFSDIVTDTYEYDPSPDCSRIRRDCGSKYLRCHLGRGRCIPIDPNRGPPVTRAPVPPTTPRPRPTQPPTRRPRPTRNPWNSRGNPWNVQPTNPNINPWNVRPNIPTIPDPPFATNIPAPDPDDWLSAPMSCGSNSKTIHPIQNTFCLDGVCDTSGWVYVPVKVVSMRPPGMHSYKSYPVSNGHIMRSNDIYKDSAYSDTNRFINTVKGAPKGYQRCNDDQGFSQIFVQSTGLNYDGFYKESAIIDQRLATSLAVAYVAVKNPKRGKVKAVFRAFDSCGRICHTACKVPGTDRYESCTGVLDIADVAGKPRQYSNTYGQATMNTWGYKQNQDCPSFMVDDISLTFYCDYRDHIPWAEGRAAQLKPLPKSVPSLFAIPEPQAQPIVRECRVDKNCILDVPCQKGKAQCSNFGETHKCRNTCNKYAVCNYGRYWTRTCANSLSFNEQLHHCTSRKRCWTTVARPRTTVRRTIFRPRNRNRSSYLQNLGNRLFGNRRFRTVG